MKAQAVFQDVGPDQKADAADEDQQHEGDVDDGVPRPGGERGEGAAEAAHQVEARIAEGGNGMEQAVEYALPRAEDGDEPDGEQRRPGQLRDGGAGHDDPGQGKDLPHVGDVDALTHDGAAAKTDPPPHEQKEEGGDGHKAQSADLDQQDDHHLAERGPLGGRVPQHQTRDAGGGGGGEQRLDQRGGGAVGAGNRQHEQQRAQRDHDKVAQRDDPDV